MAGINKRIRGFVASVVAAAMAFTLALPGVAFADSSRMVTLGVDLSPEQRATVLKFFNLTEDDLKDMEVINVNNQDERRYLEGTLSDDIIGWKTYSCSYIEPKTSGGLRVETANLTYVTKNTLYNALQTAGVENCSLVVTAPFPVSGTGALTGVFMAYEQRGVKLDEEKKDAATTELVQTAQLEGKYGEPVAEVISDVKNQVVSDKGELTDDQIRELIKDAAKLKGIDVTDADIDTILSIVEKVKGLDYDLDAFSNTLDDFKKALDDATSKGEEATGILEAIGNFFQGIIDWFVGLFNGGQQPADDKKADEQKNEGDSLIGDLNTDVFSLDSGDATETKKSEPATGTETTTTEQEAPAAVTETNPVTEGTQAEGQPGEKSADQQEQQPASQTEGQQQQQETPAAA